MKKRFAASALLVFLSAGICARIATAQIRFTPIQLYVQFRSMSNRAKPQGEVKARLAEIEKNATAAFRAGKTGEVRRLFAQGRALLQGKSWTPVDDFQHSLVLRTDTTVTDPSQPFYARLAQIYWPDYQAKGEITLDVALAERRGRGRLIQPGQAVKDFGRFIGVSTDLVDAPFLFQLDLSGISQGTYLLTATLHEGEAEVGRLWIPVVLVDHLYAARAEISSALAGIRGHEGTKASILYPFDLARRVNLGEMPAVGYDFPAEIRRSQSLLEKLRQGEDPLYQAKGLLRRHYFFDEAHAIMPYGLYVPTTYDGKRAFPLIIGLHGLGGNEWGFWSRDNGLLAKLAEKYGYIVATPLGYDRTSPYGRTGLMRDPAQQRKSLWSEQDVLNVLKLVETEYRIDKKRVYLMGHSMGGSGTWYLGSKHPEVWAALAPISGGLQMTREQLERMKDVPVLVTHGDQDMVVSVEASRRAVRMMKELGMSYVYNEVPGGSHSSVVAGAWEKMFPFFNKYAKK